MPPKPFKPPRPAAPKPKAKTTSTSVKKSTTPKDRISGIGVTKSKPAGKAVNGKNGKDKDTLRISAASRLSFAGLPSLSPDSEDEREGNVAIAGGSRRGVRAGNGDSEEDMEDAEEEDSDPLEEDDLPQTTKARRPSTSTTKPKSKLRKSHSSNPGDPSASPEPEDAIPLDLLNVLLHQFYKEDNTRMSKDANRAVGRYMETFVREALARVAYVKGGGKEGVGAGNGGEVLEVEDLEKVAPQLLLDF